MKKTLCIICSLVMAVVLTVTALAGSVDICGVPTDASHTPTPLSATGSLGQTFKPKTAFNTITIFAPTWNKTDSGFTFALYSGGPTGKMIFKQTVKNAADGSTTFIIGDTMGGVSYYYQITNPVDQIGLWTRPTDVYSDGAAYVNGTMQNYDFEFDVVYDNTHTTAVDNELNSSSSTPSSSTPSSSTPSSSTPSSSTPASSSSTSSSASSSVNLFSDGFENGQNYTVNVISDLSNGDTADYNAPSASILQQVPNKIASSGPRGTLSAFNGSNMLAIDTYDEAVGSQLRVAYNNPLKLTGATGTKLSFELYLNQWYPTTADYLQAQVSTDGTNWTNVGDNINIDNTSASGWSKITIDLSKYDNTPSLYLGFLSTSGYGPYTTIDDVSVDAAAVVTPSYKLTAPATFTKSGSNYVTTVSVDRNQAAQLTNPKLYVVYTIQVGGKQYQTYQCLDISSGDTTTKDIVVSAGFSKVMAFLVNGNVDWSQGLPNMQSNALNISIPS